MKRIIIGVTVAGTLALVTGATLAVRAGNGGPPTGVAAGLSHPTNNVTACSAIGGGGGLCTVAFSGTYFGPPSQPGPGLIALGNGTYSGKVTIDWSTYGIDGNAAGCASAYGTITYTLNGGLGVLTTSVAEVTGSPVDTVCEQPDYPWIFNRLFNLDGNVTKGTGKYKKVIAAQSEIFFTGMSSALPTGLAPVTGYEDIVTLGGFLIVP
jgi:hypothetical protein